MTVDLLPNPSTASSPARLGGEPLPPWEPFVPQCESATAEPDCPYCSGPETD